MITSVYIDTDELVFQLHSVSDDAQKALEWVRSFRDTLMFGARIANPLPFAMECMAMSEGFSASGVLGKLRAAARKRLNDEGIEATPESIDAEIVRTQGADAVREMTAKIAHANRLKAEIRRRKFTADGDIREDSLARQDGSAITRNETRAHDALEPSANHYGDAAAREGAEVVNSRESGVAAPTTVSRNMRRVPQNEAPAHGFSGGRTAQGTMYRSPEAAAQSGKDYDQEPVKTTISTNSPDASVGNAEGVYLHGSVSTSATSGQTITTAETLDKASAGEVPPENVSAKSSPALPVISFGEFGNIKMTNMQYAKLCERFGCADTVIEEADQYFEAQPAKKKKYKNHYAMLLNWCKRRETEAKPQQRYKNINDINQENYEKAMREIEAMCAGEAL